MLHAILRGKAGRIEREGESLRWRDLFKGSEDLLRDLHCLENFSYFTSEGCRIPQRSSSLSCCPL